MEQTHAVIDFLAKLVELAGVAIIIGGTLLSSCYFLREGVRGDWRQAYDRYRANLGRGILLGLELLVGADRRTMWRSGTTADCWRPIVAEALVVLKKGGRNR